METQGLTSLQRHWSTADVEPARALSYWIDTVGHTMLEMEIDSDDRHHFRAKLDQTELGPASLNHVHAQQQHIRRTRSTISRSRYSVFFLLQLRTGPFRLKQRGREVDLRVGECALLDGREPFLLICPEETRCLSIRFPQEWLKLWVPAAEDLAARPLNPANGWSRALSAALSTLDPHSCDDLALPRGVVAEQLAAMLALAAGNDSQGTRGRRTLFDRLVQTVRDRCHEADLTPDVLAKEHGVSKRYVHYSFAQRGMTFGAELINIRLQRARQLLSDRRFLDVPIGEVSARCGFIEPSHFARRFRQKFGQGPALFRKSIAPAD